MVLTTHIIKLIISRDVRVPRKPAAEKPKTRCMIAKLKVLVVEHEIPAAMTMVSLLTQAGCAVKAVCTGQKGMNLAAWRKFDLIVLDIGLPDMSSLEICDDLKQRHISKHTPIVFIGNAGDDFQRCLEHGAADYIAKPFETFEFASRLLSHIKQTEATA